MASNTSPPHASRSVASGPSLISRTEEPFQLFANGIKINKLPRFISKPGQLLPLAPVGVYTAARNGFTDHSVDKVFELDMHLERLARHPSMASWLQTDKIAMGLLRDNLKANLGRALAYRLRVVDSKLSTAGFSDIKCTQGPLHRLRLTVVVTMDDWEDSAALSRAKESLVKTGTADGGTGLQQYEEWQKFCKELMECKTYLSRPAAKVFSPTTAPIPSISNTGPSYTTNIPATASSRSLHPLLCLVSVQSIPEPPTTAKIQLRLAVRHNPQVKSTQWARDRQILEKMKSKDTEEIGLVSDAGAVTEGLSSNFFVINNVGSLETASTEAVLPGTVRECVIKACERLGIPVKFSAPRVSEAGSWRSAFITSTSRLVMPVDTVDIMGTETEAGKWKIKGDDSLLEKDTDDPILLHLKLNPVETTLQAIRSEVLTIVENSCEAVPLVCAPPTNILALYLKYPKLRAKHITLAPERVSPRINSALLPMSPLP
eukprot:Filipodium_phascolosomae@DN6775_c0_g1_i1.p1